MEKTHIEIGLWKNVIFQLSWDGLIKERKGRNYGEDMGSYLISVGTLDS